MGRIIAYARVSTQEQSLDRQLDALKSRGYDVLFQEKITGTRADRPQLGAALNAAMPGDTLLVESFFRLSRSTKDLLALIETLGARGVSLVSLKERLDTSTPAGRLMLTMFAALSQFERDVLAERTREGLRAARARGRKGGRPRADEKAVGRALKLYSSGSVSVSEIVGMTGVSASTLYRRIREHAAH